MDVEDLKARVAEFSIRVKEVALDLLDDFKEQTVYFKQRVAVISGYAGIVILTLIFAPIAAVSNPIDVQIKATAIPWGLREKTVVEVRNNSSDAYKKLRVVVKGNNPAFDGRPASSGNWTFKARKMLLPGEELQLESKHFHDDSGVGPNMDFDPKHIEVQCSDGIFAKDIVLRHMQ